MKTNVDVLEKDYVVPATAFTVVKCDQILAQVDETLALTEETVYKTVEKTKETVTGTVEQTKETVTNAVVSTLNVGLDTIETGLDYALPAAEEKRSCCRRRENRCYEKSFCVEQYITYTFNKTCFSRCNS